MVNSLYTEIQSIDTIVKNNEIIERRDIESEINHGLIMYKAINSLIKEYTSPENLSELKKFGEE
jgi:hypothetical protein